MLARYNGNVVPFADDATSTNRTVFGGTTQSDTLDDNLNADFKKGWEIVGLNNNPTREDFNAMGYTLGALTAYLYEMGIAEYNALQEYKLNGLCLGTDGTIYQSLVDSNIGNALTNGTKWKNVTSSFVNLVNNQSIDGIKTFVKSPIVPTPTSGTQAVNKDYVDNGAGATFVANDSRVKTALNATGTAPIYACRAWVNFNGTGTVAIRASGNVSSITDNGTGNYTVNFTTAMTDTNYSVATSAEDLNANMTVTCAGIANLTTTSIGINISNTAAAIDIPIACASIFR